MVGSLQPRAGVGLTDGHVHLDAYSPEERKAVLRRGDGAGLRYLLTVGMDVATSTSGLEIARAGRRGGREQESREGTV